MRTEEESSQVRYVVGIDLGTTNCAVSYVDLRQTVEAGSGVFPTSFLIPQAVAPNVVEERDVLPSFFARFPDPPVMNWEERDPRRDFSLKGRGAVNPKDGKFGVVGTLARDYGASEPESFVSSAKSWLCHARVDRTAPILPWNAAASDDSDAATKRRWSPVEISSYYLAHIRAAWNDRFPDFPLETQDVVLTIPASFDETARTLTLAAAKLAGIPRAALVEEPQAAFYSWLARHENDWTQYVKPSWKILVCDVGGGTTDFALIYALQRDDETSDALAKSVKFYRVAVGDHLTLGGDNLDLTLYKYLEAKILERRPGALSSRERATLLKEAREAKELFLGENSGEQKRTFVLPGVGSKLVGGSATIEIDRADVEKLLVDGFFPIVEKTSVPARRRTGVRETGLPYAFDPAVTKHLARFLATHKDAGRDLERAGALGGLSQLNANADAPDVDVVLFNGGAFESPKLRARIVESLEAWQGGVRPVVLQNENLYLAVAHGAAYYGLALRGLVARVGASLARTYYVGVDLNTSGDAKAKPKAVCLLPAQCEPGDEIVLEKTFELAVDRPAVFPIFTSSARMTDAPGDLIEIDPNETRELAPIRTALKTKSRAKKDAGTIRAKLVARPTEIGTIELFLQEVLSENADSKTRASRWTLQFDARGATQSDWEQGESVGEEEGVVDESLIESGKRVLIAAFAPDDELGGVERVKPGDFFWKLSQALGTSKNETPITTLRRLAESTLELSRGRKRSSSVEARWLNWLGLRSGPALAPRPTIGASNRRGRASRVSWRGERRSVERSTGFYGVASRRDCPPDDSKRLRNRCLRTFAIFVARLSKARAGAPISILRRRRARRSGACLARWSFCRST
ncbi:MAG: Hsp70 family protein [Thermoguttaceae bacterium]|nr:Hsp70 family protein [Thermoguttaceae bacterium]